MHIGTIITSNEFYLDHLQPPFTNLLTMNSVLYDATGVIRGISKERLYQELDFESSQYRDGFTNYNFFTKKKKMHRLIFQLDSKSINCILFTQFKYCESHFFRKQFPAQIIERSKKKISELIRPDPNDIFNVPKILGLIFHISYQIMSRQIALTRLSSQLS